jgi:hypothetical protein
MKGIWWWFPFPQNPAFSFLQTHFTEAKKNDILSLHPSQIPQLDSITLARAAPKDPAAVGHGGRGR